MLCECLCTVYQEYIIKEESIEPLNCVRKVTWFCTFGTGSMWRDIACLECRIGRTRCFNHYLTSREFSRDTDFIPAISYSRHCVSYLISWLSRYFPKTFTISYIGSSTLFSFIIILLSIPIWVGRVNGLNFVLVGRTHVATIHRVLPMWVQKNFNWAN